MPEEVWKPVVGFADYEVSDLGRVRSWKHRTPGKRRNEAKLLSPATGGPYCSLVLRRDGASVTRRVHRLVLETFVGPCPEGMECLHGDGNRLNNKLSNLSWGTPLENMADQRRHGAINHSGIHNGAAKLTDDAVRQIRASDSTNAELGRQFGVSATTICSVRKRRLWTHVPQSHYMSGQR